MNILFRTSGGKAVGKELGLGHIYRSLNLAHYFTEHKVYFLIEDYGGVKAIFSKLGLDNVFFIDPDSKINEDIKKTISIIKKKKIDITIMDKYKIKNNFVRNIMKYTKTVVISDLKNIDYDADLVVNGFVGYNNSTVLNKFRRTCLIGPKYQILNEKFLKRKYVKKEFDILITFGGLDEKNITELVLKTLLSNKYKLKSKIILGPSIQNRKKFDKYKKENKDKMEIKFGTDNMFKEISTSKLGICSGGITSYEFALMKVPFIIICQVKHQLLTANEWEKKGIAINLGIVNNKTKEKVEECIKQFKQKKLILKSTSLIDGKGGKRVYDNIIKLNFTT
jgi:UDP-2,4-diacetamido-2,4,6-trideoxy-beta-L-altropyranose hydrolase